jgi:hypothetical protein
MGKQPLSCLDRPLVVVSMIGRKRKFLHERIPRVEATIGEAVRW